MVNLSWVSISPDQKVTPTLVTSVWVKNTHNSKIFWHVYQIVNMLGTQGYVFFYCFILIFYVFFSTTTAIKSYFTTLFFVFNFFNSFIFTKRTTSHIPCRQHSCLVFGMQVISWKKMNILIGHWSQSYE